MSHKGTKFTLAYKPDTADEISIEFLLGTVEQLLVREASPWDLKKILKNPHKRTEAITFKFYHTVQCIFTVIKEPKENGEDGVFSVYDLDENAVALHTDNLMKVLWVLHDPAFYNIGDEEYESIVECLKRDDLWRSGALSSFEDNKEYSIIQTLLGHILSHMDGKVRLYIGTDFYESDNRNDLILNVKVDFLFLKSDWMGRNSRLRFLNFIVENYARINPELIKRIGSFLSPLKSQRFGGAGVIEYEMKHPGRHTVVL